MRLHLSTQILSLTRSLSTTGQKTSAPSTNVQLLDIKSTVPAPLACAKNSNMTGALFFYQEIAGVETLNILSYLFISFCHQESRNLFARISANKVPEDERDFTFKIMKLHPRDR
ncbi:hypothetical protein BDDG_12524 [Blastomyces dermatitidis ATCC 18188]|uniref:Uncharacterized protein n=1 Tax=Ajellomyces dermatitidis (strain ATCC 18188 / CBS 674.68) TaxID=653446 RepID=A0A0J9ES78_AJEDA|nr:hypothetical protein BDDG_12524 [Blastomyces dermatitidis ATCC 18188]